MKIRETKKCIIMLWSITMWKNLNKKKLFSFMSNSQTFYHFKLAFQKVDQHTGGKWFINGTKRSSYMGPTAHIYIYIYANTSLLFQIDAISSQQYSAVFIYVVSK